LSLGALLLVGCASSGGAGPISAGRVENIHQSGYQVHEATEETEGDGLQVSLDHGFISQEAAQDAVMLRWPQLRRCQSAAGAASDFASGAVTLRFAVAPGGQTAAVQVTDTHLGNHEIEECLIAVGRTVTFPRPQGGAEATVDYTLEFKSSGEVAVVDVPADDPRIQAQLGQAAAHCDSPGSEVTATVYVDAGGAVRSTGLASTAPLLDATATCLAQALRRTPLPPRLAPGSALARLTVPLPSTDLIARDVPAPARQTDHR
jgi:hypothetical protein